MATFTKIALSVIGRLKADRVKGRGGEAVIVLPPAQEHVLLAQTVGYPAGR